MPGISEIALGRRRLVSADALVMSAKLSGSVWNFFNYISDQSVCQLYRNDDPTLKCGKIYWGMPVDQLQLHLDFCHPTAIMTGTQLSTLYQSPLGNEENSNLPSTSETPKTVPVSEVNEENKVQQFILHQLSQVFHERKLNPCKCSSCVDLYELLDCHNHVCADDSNDETPQHHCECRLSLTGDEQQMVKSPVPCNQPQLQDGKSTDTLASLSKAAAILRVARKGNQGRWVRPKTPRKSAEVEDLIMAKSLQLESGVEMESIEVSGDESQPDFTVEGSEIVAETETILKSPITWQREYFVTSPGRADVEVVEAFGRVKMPSRLRSKSGRKPKILKPVSHIRRSAVKRSVTKPAINKKPNSIQPGPPVKVRLSEEFPLEAFAYGKHLVALVKRLDAQDLAKWRQKL